MNIFDSGFICLTLCHCSYIFQHSPHNFIQYIEFSCVFVLFSSSPKDFHRENVTDLGTLKDNLSTKFRAKTIYLGTYVFEPSEDIFVTSKGIRIYAPSVKHPNEKTVLDIQKSEIVKIVSHFSQKSLITIYVLNTCSRYVRENLDMSKDNKCE